MRALLDLAVRLRTVTRRERGFGRLTAVNTATRAAYGTIYQAFGQETWPAVSGEGPRTAQNSARGAHGRILFPPRCRRVGAHGHARRDPHLGRRGLPALALRAIARFRRQRCTVRGEGLPAWTRPAWSPSSARAGPRADGKARRSQPVRQRRWPAKPGSRVVSGLARGDRRLRPIEGALEGGRQRPSPMLGSGVRRALYVSAGDMRRSGRAQTAGRQGADHFSEYALGMREPARRPRFPPATASSPA